MSWAESGTWKRAEPGVIDGDHRPDGVAIGVHALTDDVSLASDHEEAAGASVIGDVDAADKPAVIDDGAATRGLRGDLGDKSREEAENGGESQPVQARPRIVLNVHVRFSVTSQIRGQTSFGF